jgi:hypothetical protein
VRALVALAAILTLLSCGPETAPATATPSRAAVTTASATPSTNTGPATSASRTTAPATTSAPTAVAGASPALAECASEPSMRSQAIAVDAHLPLVFLNDTGVRRDVVALDDQGKRMRARSVSAGMSYTAIAYPGEVWVVTDAGGTCTAIQTVVAPTYVILSAARTSLVRLYAIRGSITDASSGSPLAGQSIFIWQPDESACAIIGGSGSPGYVVSSITAPDGTYLVYVTAGDYKVRVRTAPVNGTEYAPQWWRNKPASTAAQCAAADIVSVNDGTVVDFALARQ